MVRGDVATATEHSLVARFDEIPFDAAAIAGGKGASLSRMAGAGLPVPPGFLVCTGAFRSFLENCGGLEMIRRLVTGLDVTEQPALEHASASIRDLIRTTPAPRAIAQAVSEAYLALGCDVPVAVRSSAASEDGAAASFAGQHETFLNVRGAEAVMFHVRECWASLFSPRAIFYRARKGSLHDSRMAVVVQEMAPGEKSGVLFTVDPVQNRHDRMVIEAVRGLGESLVSGSVTPDHYVLDRDNGSIVQEFIVSEDGVPFLNALQLRRLFQAGLRLEAFFGKPQDVEWCLRGEEIFLLQSRPITALGGPRPA
jgi:pyruvate, water dikinase